MARSALRLRIAGAAVATCCAAGVAAPVMSAEGVESGSATAVAAKRITGRWVGIVRNDVGGPYKTRVRIRKTDNGFRGRVIYPECRGIWRFKRRHNGWHKFREIIKKDPGKKSCVRRLNVKVKRVKGTKLRVVWTFKQRRTSMTAHRPRG